MNAKIPYEAKKMIIMLSFQSGRTIIASIDGASHNIVYYWAMRRRLI